jgi:hydroxymethylbilane synthase
MTRHKVRIATRGSKLALWQAEWVRTEIQKMHPELSIELLKIKTTGDKILDVPLAQVGGKGLFVKEIEEALLRGDADLAVHSMKDVPTEFPEGLHLFSICRREDPRDALIVNSRLSTSAPVRSMSNATHASLLFALPSGAAIGTSSLRRACQLMNLRPDVKIVQLRGNLDTRVRKLDEGQFDAIVVACAGMKRLGLGERITEVLDTEISLPAIGQGAVGIECRIEDSFISSLIAPLHHEETALCVIAERAFLRRLEGGCQVPIAAHARIARNESGIANQSRMKNLEIRTPFVGKVIMEGLVGSVDGKKMVKGAAEGRPDDCESMGIRLAEDLLDRGADDILSEVYGR